MVMLHLVTAKVVRGQSMEKVGHDSVGGRAITQLVLPACADDRIELPHDLRRRVEIRPARVEFDARAAVVDLRALG
jgi:hypothetical protein